jgi:hypothetical protein
MKRQIIFFTAFCALILGTNVLADTFNYASIDSCQNSMGAYALKANDYMNNAINDADYVGWWNMYVFFTEFDGNPSFPSKQCVNGQCSYKAAASCQFANNTAVAPWTNLITPILNKEVNAYLNNGQYDHSFTTSNTVYYISCTYPGDESTPIPFDNTQECKISN